MYYFTIFRGRSSINLKKLNILRLPLFLLIVLLFLVPLSRTEASSTDGWNATYYSKQDFTGTTVKKTYDNLNLSWGGGSPVRGIPSDHFSAVFEKKVVASKDGYYSLKGKADDGARIYIDGKLAINLWKDGLNYFNNVVKLSAGSHTIKVQYYDNKYSASLKVDLKALSVDKWDATFYSTKDLKGTAVERTYDNLNFSWGGGSPAIGIPSDHFSSVFQKQINVDKNSYYNFTGKADDGVRIYIDGVMKLDQWKDGVNNFSKIVNLSSGLHSVRVEYYDNKYSASFKMDMTETPVDNWHATYYTSPDLSGNSTEKIYDNINFSWGSGSPDPSIPSDHFSATFVKKMIVEQDGNYQFSGSADDGIRIYIDGQKVADDKWKNGVNNFNYVFHLGEGIHSIKIDYYENTGSAALKLNINKSNDLISNNKWRARFYSTPNFTGKSIEHYYDNLTFSWGVGSPDSGLPTDHFSGVFEKKIIITQNGNYRFFGRADDGVKVYIDGILQINQWKYGVNNYSKISNLTTGYHTIRVEYFDNKYSASINFNIESAFKVKINHNTSYDYPIKDAVTRQMKSGSPQTDTQYDTYVFADALNISTTNPNQGTVINGSWNVRGGPSTDYWVVGTVSTGDKLDILSKVQDSNGDYWYKFNYKKTWVNASPDDVAYYLNPSNFKSNTSSYYQFLLLSQSTGLSATEVNQKVLLNKGMLSGKAQAFINAGKQNHINEIYLISHALLETGNGTSDLANGIKVSQVDGKPVTPKVVYNMYGINAKDSCPIKCGSEYAYKQGWFTPDAAIIGGAAFIANGYINNGQDTLYKMKWNPANITNLRHQYATDIGWAVKQTSSIYNLYNLLDSYIITFDIPTYN